LQTTALAADKPRSAFGSSLAPALIYTRAKMSHARAQAPGPPSSEGTKTFIRELADKGEFEAVQRDFGETWTHKSGVYAANAKVALLAAAPATAADAASAGSPSMVRFSAAGASPVEMTPLASALESGGDDAPIDAASAAEASRAIQGAMDEMSASKAPSSSSARVVNTRKKVSLHVLKINGLALPSSEGPSPAVVVDSTTSFPSAANPAAPPPAAADSDDDESGFVRKRKGGQKRSQSVDAKTKKPRSRSAVPRGVQTTTFGVFSAKARAALKVSAPHLTQSEIIARISLDWATVGEDEKREYAETAGKARAAMASAQPASASEVRHEGGVAAVLDNDDDDAAAAPTDGAAGSSAARVSKMSREEATGEGHSAPEEPPSKSAAPKRAQPSSTIDSRLKPSLSKAASSAPVRKGACSTSSYATNDDDLLPASTADPRADAVRAAALRAASGRELATVRPDGTIMEDGEGFNRERCFPRQTGRMNYKDFDVNREGTRVAVVLPCLITWLADLSSEGTRGDIRSAAASSFLESAQTLSQLEPYYKTTQSGVLFGTVRAVEKAVDAPVRDGWSILTIDLCRSASSSDGEDWGDDGTGEDGEPIASIRLPWLPPKSPLINAPYTLLASAYSASPPASMKPGAQMRMLFSTGKASEGEWHEGRVYALQIRAEDVARGWPLSRFRAVRVIWYDQLAEGAQQWFMEATQVRDCCEGVARVATYTFLTSPPLPRPAPAPPPSG
jgi:hypothetical protein